MYWCHQTNDFTSPKYPKPEELFKHSDVYYEDFCYNNNSPHLVFKTCGLRHCEPSFRMINRLVSRHVIHYIVSGQGWCNGIKVKEGDVIYFKARTPYNFSSNPADPCVYGWVTFQGEKCGTILENLGLHKDMEIYTTNNMKEIFSVLYELMYVSQESADTDLYMESRLFRVLSLSGVNLKKEPVEDTGASGAGRVYTAMKYIAENYRRPDLRVGEIADHVNLSENYLRKIFKAGTGLSVRDYIIKTKINAAKFLLETSNYNINEITEYVGFSDYRQFSELFKKKTNTVPSKYRESKRPEIKSK